MVMAREPAEAPGAVELRTGNLTEPAALRAALTAELDAVVHAATPTGDWDVDLGALDVMTRGLSGRALVYLSGVWVLGATTEPATEASPVAPLEIVAGRPRLEEHVRTAEDLRGIVVRPGIVHGHGGGIPAMMLDWARAAGIGRYVGDATVRWPMVHVDDVADLVVLALERAERGALLHGVAEAAVPVVRLAAAADLAAGGEGRTEAWATADAAAVLGSPLAAALSVRQHVTAPAARALGWVPHRADAVSDLRGGSYPPAPADVPQSNASGQR